MQSSDGSQAAPTKQVEEKVASEVPQTAPTTQVEEKDASEVPKAAPTRQLEENNASEVSEEAIRAWLKREEVREKLVYADTALCDEIIARYLAELDGVSPVPVLRGYCAVRPVAKPRSLDEAGRIWRENFMGNR